MGFTPFEPTKAGDRNNKGCKDAMKLANACYPDQFEEGGNIWLIHEALSGGCDDKSWERWATAMDKIESSPPSKSQGGDVDERIRVVNTFQFDYLFENVNLRYNSMDLRFELDGKPLLLAELKCDMDRTMLIKEQPISVSVDSLKVWLAGQSNRLAYNPVREYLYSLPPGSGIDRLRNHIEAIFGFDGSALETTLITRWMISAIARVMQPGCKADSLLLLCGAQGHGKSSFFDILGGKFYATGSYSEGGKDALMKLTAKWIVELGEIDGTFRQRDIAPLKDFISTRRDSFRKPYASEMDDYPRVSVFGATSNHREILSDETGNRRFWTVWVESKIDIDYLTKVRDEIWADALALYQGGEQWHLTDQESDLFGASQKSFEKENPYQTELELWFASRSDRKKPLAISKGVLWQVVFGQDPVPNNASGDKQLVAALKALGWYSKQFRDGNFWVNCESDDYQKVKETDEFEFRRRMKPPLS